MALTIIGSGKATGGSYPHLISIYIGVETISQSVVNNNGVYRVRAWLVNGTSGTPWNTWPNQNAYYLRVNGNTIKSGTQFVDFRKSSTHVIADEQVTLSHDSAGRLTFTAEARQAITDVSTFDYAWRNGTYTAPQIKRASRISASNITAGNDIPITITAEQTGVTHDIELKYGNTSIRKATDAGAPSTFQITTANWNTINNLAKSTTSFNLTLILTTRLAGSVIGTNSTNCTVTYPASVRPTLTSVTATDGNARVNSILGASNFLQTISDLSVKINGASGASGSTITEYEISVNGTIYNTHTRRFNPAKSGSYEVKGRVKDTRGRWSDYKTLTLEVKPYARPQARNYSITRADSNGTGNQLGIYGRHTATVSASSTKVGASEKNKVSYEIKTRAGVTVLTRQNLTTLTGNVNRVLGTYAIDNSYEFRLIVYDVYNESTSSDFTLPSARVPFTLSKRGASIGGIFDNSDSANAQVYGDLSIKESGGILTGAQRHIFNKQITSGEDLNNLTDTGTYYCPQNAVVGTLLNCPIANAFSMTVTKHAGYSQIIIPYMTTSHDIYHRNFYAGTWGSWKVLGGETYLARGGDHLNGWEDLPNGLRRNWRTVTHNVLGDDLSPTGPEGAYKSGWLINGNWLMPFTSVPRQQVTMTVPDSAWTWLGGVRAPTATGPSNVFIYKFAKTVSLIVLYFEAVGPR